MKIATEKRCCTCRTIKPASEFGLRSNGRWLRAECRECNRANRKRRYHDDPAKAQVSVRRSHLKRSYGLTEEQYAERLAMQDGRCAICGTSTPSRSPTRPNFVVDHDHSTNQVRGLLCQRCNLGIGYLSDDPEVLRSAAGYIERFR